MTNEQCKDLKKGDVIVFNDYCNDERIVIFDRIEKNAFGELHLYTYAEFADRSLFLECDEPGYFYILGKDIINYRFATEEEKIKLYNEIGKHFTEEYDKDWYNHFTDSSYFDIKDYLFSVFGIEVGDYDDDLIYPDFINEIHTYIWDKLCKAMNVTDTDVNKPEMVNKQEFITKVKKWLELETNWGQEFDENGRNENYGKIDELIKYLEEQNKQNRCSKIGIKRF